MTTYCAPCREIACTNPPDSETYSLQSDLVFTSGVLSAVASCPVGFDCLPGVFPRSYTYDDNWTIVIPGPVRTNGGPIILRGCQSDIVRIIPAGATDAEVQAIVSAMFVLAAQQQAECDAKNEPGVRPKPEAPELDISLLSPRTACLSTAYSATVFVTEPATFSIIGSLPAGLTLTAVGATTSATISGTPTTAGTFPFVIHAEFVIDGQVVSANQQVNFHVVGITTASPLTNAVQSAAYSETIAASGMTGTLIWSVSTGTLPAGLTLNPATGEISGTPTTVGSSTFTISVAGQTTCSKEFSITVEVPTTLFVWGIPVETFVGAGSALFTPNNTSGNAAVAASTDDGTGIPSTVSNTGLITINTLAVIPCNMHIKSTYTGPGPGVDFGTGWNVIVSNNTTFANLVFEIGDINVNINSEYDVPFNLPNTGGVNNIIEWQVVTLCGELGFNTSLTLEATFSVL